MSRAESSVIELATAFAESRSDISYLIQNGSRVNPSVDPDRYADYDLIFGCPNPRPYIEDRRWMAEFGSLLILQLNELGEGESRWPIFLMQFEGGLRIDAQFYPGEGRSKYGSDSLSRILLDKRGELGPPFEPSEESYFARMPGPEEYRKAVNEFWWCIINVGKGLARDELTYARFMYESVVREAFLRIVSWYASSKKDWRVNAGKFGKFLRRSLDPEDWAELEASYLTDRPEEFWSSIYAACRFVERLDAELRVDLRLEAAQEKPTAIVAFLKGIQEGMI